MRNRITHSHIGPIAVITLVSAFLVVAMHPSQAAPTPAATPATAPAKDEPKPGSKITFTIKGVDFTFCYIPAGEFMMGSPESEAGRATGEKPHKVIITKPFYMMEHEITQEQYETLVPTRDDGVQSLESHFKGAKRPRESICFTDMGAKKVWDRMAAETKMKFRLPTEAEWEYACRAGTTTPFHYGKDLDSTLANFDGHEPYGNGARGKLRNETVDVKQFKPNAWGLYDMHGNVAEACADYVARNADLCVDGIKDPGAADPDAIGMDSVHVVAYVGDLNALVPAAAKAPKPAKEEEADPAAVNPKGRGNSGKVVLRSLGKKPGQFEVEREKVVFARVVFCGGGYNAPGSECRAASRLAINNDHAGNDFCGFRLVLIPGDTPAARPATATGPAPNK